MKSAGYILIMLWGMLCTPLSNTFAQLTGPGNIDWQEVWVVYPPTTNDPSNPNNWMRGNNRYTGLAYDKWNDVVYIVNPGTCAIGNLSYKCMRVFAWDAETGTEAARIQNPTSGTPAGQLFVNSAIVNEGFSQGQYAIYKIDLDDQGRIYACNAVAPVFGICYPGPAPDCDPDFLTQGPWKLYRWDSPFGDVETIYETGGNISNPEMSWRMWGTVLDVVGKEYQTATGTFDSVRVFTSGGKFYTGDVTVNDEVNIFVYDDRPTRPHKFRFGIRMKHNQSESGFAAHGIAATGPYPESQIYVDANFRDVTLQNQFQDNAAMPQYYLASLNHAIPASITGSSGAIAYFVDERYNLPYLITADGINSSTNFTQPNSNTCARVIDLSSGPSYQNWPPEKTPQIGNNRLNNFTGEDNWISDVDYKIWINDIPNDPYYGKPHLQLFVLMSNNGIASFRTRKPLRFPVEMQTFRGIIDGSDIALAWQVASETNNKGFEVYRSFNMGTDWEKLGFVQGRGTTSSASEYTFRDPITDIHTNVSDVQYRLKQIDYDGKYTWTSAIDVLLNPVPTAAILYQNYPNPFTTSTKIGYQIQEESYVRLDIFNELGDKVATLCNGQEEAGLHYASMEANNLPSGSYMCRLNVNGQYYHKQMVLSR